MYSTWITLFLDSPKTHVKIYDTVLNSYSKCVKWVSQNLYFVDVSANIAIKYHVSNLPVSSSYENVIRTPCVDMAIFNELQLVQVIS